MELPDPLRMILLRWFVTRYKLNMDEAAKELSAYRSIADLFTRKLREGVRPIKGQQVSPVDGTLRDSGRIESDRLTQVKGLTYSLGALLTASGPSPDRFRGGTFFNFYLSPRDYHRIHSPVSGVVRSVTYVSGTLWPVNDWALQSVRELFVQNARVVVELETDQGPVAVVLIGALNVGQIVLSFQNVLPPKPAGAVATVTPNQGFNLLVGQELGMFRMGSAVVCLFGPGFSSPTTSISTSVHVGDALFQS